MAGDEYAFNCPGRPHLAEAMAEHFGSNRIADSPLTMVLGRMTLTGHRAIQRHTRVCGVGLGRDALHRIRWQRRGLESVHSQKDLVRAVHALNVPIIGVFIEGRPRTFADINR